MGDMLETMVPDRKAKKVEGNHSTSINIKHSALASPITDTAPPNTSGFMLGSIPTKTQIEARPSFDRQTSESKSSVDEGDGMARGREIHDSLTGRILYLQWTIAAIIIEVILIYILFLLHSPDGWTVPFGGQTFHQTVPVFMELWMHLCYICTEFALSKSLAAYFGHQLAQRRGYSLIVCGFIQSGLFAKIQFSSLLNFRSKYKKIVSRASILWLTHMLMLILTFFCSTAITIGVTRYESGSLKCAYFNQSGAPVDRQWPTVETESGVAEFIFGSSLGLLSSEHGTPNSTLFTYPQLIDSCADGTEIKGPGFSTNFQTTCFCAPTDKTTDLEYAGVDSNYSSAMRIKLLTLGAGQGIIQQLYFNETANSIQVYSLLAGYRTCGGSNYANKSTLVCTTSVASHNTAEVSISWMNDGNNARSAPNIVKNDDTFVSSPANMTWLYAAMKNAQEGTDLAVFKLPGYYPGTVNPLLWWTTPNLQTVSVAFVVAGFETFMAMFIKVGITRTYSVSGAECVRSLLDNSKTTLKISESGFTFGLVFACLELLLGILSILGCIPWFICKDPIIPAIRMVSDRTYFNIMLCKNSTGNMLRMIGSTADRTDIWPKLDMEVRVGENIQTVSDPQYGEIVMDKPKLVTQLSWSKYY